MSLNSFDESLQITHHHHRVLIFLDGALISRTTTVCVLNFGKVKVVRLITVINSSVFAKISFPQTKRRWMDGRMDGKLPRRYDKTLCVSVRLRRPHGSKTARLASHRLITLPARLSRFQYTSGHAFVPESSNGNRFNFLRWRCSSGVVITRCALIFLGDSYGAMGSLRFGVVVQ